MPFDISTIVKSAVPVGISINPVGISINTNACTALAALAHTRLI